MNRRYRPLHRKIGDSRVLLAIVSWESKVIRDAMEANQREAVRSIIAEQATLVDIRIIGAFEDAEWVVSPTGGE